MTFAHVPLIKVEKTVLYIVTVALLTMIKLWDIRTTV